MCRGHNHRTHLANVTEIHFNQTIVPQELEELQERRKRDSERLDVDKRRRREER